MLVQPPEATHTTFLGAPLVGDLTAVTADFAVIGVPFGVPYGMRQANYGPADAPRAIRERSFRFGRMLDHYDFDLGCDFARLGLHVVDCGDVIADVRDIDGNARNAVTAIRQLSERGAVPIVLGGSRAGYEIEHPLAVVILGGLVTSTILNLFIVPALYLKYGRPAKPVGEAGL